MVVTSASTSLPPAAASNVTHSGTDPRCRTSAASRCCRARPSGPSNSASPAAMTLAASVEEGISIAISTACRARSGSHLPSASGQPGEWKTTAERGLAAATRRGKFAAAPFCCQRAKASSSMGRQASSRSRPEWERHIHPDRRAGGRWRDRHLRQWQAVDAEIDQVGRDPDQFRGE
jgi:hypothetical protein